MKFTKESLNLENALDKEWLITNERVVNYKWNWWI